ncbi:MAG: glycosyltransferase [Candidatus Gastranaerophilales bacterium]|nr:glycosyltransferase [Candidatus Gastranaerophilales bacterium]
MPKISIIVPIYNQEKYLKRCLYSLLRQTFYDIEIICINDGSEDKSLEIIKNFQKTDCRIKLINQINSGVAQARNIGINYATGEFIGFVDPDDFIENNFFEKLYIQAIKNDCDIACTNVVRENNKKKKILIEYKKTSIATTVKEKFELAHLPEHCYIWNKIYKREKLLNAGIIFKREMVYEDIIFSPEAIEALGKMVVVSETWYHYWNNEKSIVKNSSDKYRFDKIKAKKFITEKCFKYNVKTKEQDNLICKREYFLFGIKILKVYIYRATKIFSLFGLFKILTVKEFI